jgi:hypothetical protein
VTPPQPELIGQLALCRRFGISDDTWRRWRAARLTPEPVDLPGRPRWLLSEIEAFFLRGRRRPEGGRSFFGSAVRRRRAAAA